MSKKLLGNALAVMACGLAGLPAWAAIDIADEIGHLQGAQVDSAGCGWEPGIVAAVRATAKGAVHSSGSRANASTDSTLSLQVLRLKLLSSSKASEYDAVVRADVRHRGKLVATRDFQGDESFKAGRPACDALRALGASLGEGIGDWIAKTRFPECGDGCDGIHPDETIAVGAEILIGNPDAINATVRDECRWQAAMVRKLIQAFNDSDPAPRAKLQARALDIESHPGRRLVLWVNNVHALGGGGYTGPKWMNMSGEFWDGTLLVGSFNSYTSSGRGLTTCRSLDSLSDSTVDLIVQWLQSPTLNAELK